ncbi:transmembrane and coiled-coil domain-containing protein 5B-like [Macaca fascicularis]|uniref:transmembrane and coiled-coil domain-containing protein 5B-like n=2 Tax=Macaca TaxID=9539 RepID=UPI0032B061E5
MRARLQKSTESCAKQEEELAKIEHDYQSVSELCKDQVYYIKKYQEVLRKMKEEKETLLLEKEMRRPPLRNRRESVGTSISSISPSWP